MHEKYIELLHKNFEESTKRQIEIGMKNIYLTYLSNAGALVALIGFISNAKEVPTQNYFSKGGLCFIVGVGFALFSLFFAFIQQIRISGLHNLRWNYLVVYNDYLENHKAYEGLRRGKVSQAILEKNHADLLKQKSDLDQKREVINRPFCDGFLYLAIFSGLCSGVFFLIGAWLILNCLVS